MIDPGQGAERWLSLEERDSLQRFQDSADTDHLRQLLLSLFSRVRAHLAERFPRVDLDLAFALKEENDSPELVRAFWNQDELSAFGDAFFGWAEDPSVDPTESLPVQKFEHFWRVSQEFWKSIAPPQPVDEESVEEETVENQSVEELEVPLPELEVELGLVEAGEQEWGAPEEAVAFEFEPEPEPLPTLESGAAESFQAVEEAAKEAEEEAQEERVEAAVEAPEEPVEQIHAEPEQEPEREPEQEPEREPEQEPEREPEQEPEREPEQEPAELAEQETLALGDLARQAVARAEMEAVLQERIQAILKTSLDEAPPLYQQPVTIEEIELPPDTGSKSLSPDRRTVLHSSSRDRGGAQGHEEGEELEFSRAPVSPFEKKNQLVVKNKYLGYGKNSEGVVGLCGQLKISYFNPQELVGRLESSNPLLFLSPAQLSGTNATVTYWLPPVAFPHPAGQLMIRTSSDSKTLALHSLFPKSRTDFMGARQVLTALFAPSLLGFLYFCFVYAFTAHGIDSETRALFPELYRAAYEGLETVDFRTGGLGLFRLKVVPASESLQMIWAFVLFLGPLASSKFFHYLSRSRKRRLGGALAAALLMPTILLLAMSNFQDLVLPLYEHKDFAPLDLWRFLGWSVPLNIAGAAYLFLSNFGYLDRWLRPREVRLATPFVLTGLYMLIMFILIYGRSWLS